MPALSFPLRIRMFSPLEPLLKFAPMYALIIYLLGVLTAMRYKKSDSKNIDAKASTGNYNRLPDGPISVVCIPPPKTDQETAEEKKEKRRKTVKYWAEIIGIVILGLYTVFTYKIMRSSVDTTELIRQQMAKDQAAILEAFTDYAGTDGRFRIVIQNRGKAHARSVEGDFTVLHKALPGGEMIGSPQTVKIIAGQLSTQDERLGAKERIVEVLNFSLDAVRNLRETVVIEGTFHYDDGFGNLIRDKMECQQFIGLVNEQTGVFDRQSFERCDRVPASIERSTRIANEHKNQKH